MMRRNPIISRIAGIAIIVALLLATLEALGAWQAHAATTTVVFTSNGTWTAPVGVTVVQVGGWAAGAGGGRGNSGNSRGGGGGGAYAGLNAFAVTPGNTYTVVVGQAGLGATVALTDGTAGTDSMFSASSTLLAKGGSANTTTTGGTGGQAASSVGDVKHSGGNGGSVVATCPGAGGGGAGTLNDGGIGASGTELGGTGGSVGGGNGGNTGVSSGILTAGSIKGGGGAGTGSAGGCLTNGNASNGAQGEVDITYTLPQVSASVTIGAGRTTIMAGTTVIQ